MAMMRCYPEYDNVWSAQPGFNCLWIWIGFITRDKLSLMLSSCAKQYIFHRDFQKEDQVSGKTAEVRHFSNKLRKILYQHISFYTPTCFDRVTLNFEFISRLDIVY